MENLYVAVIYTKLSTNKGFLDAALGNLLIFKIVHHNCEKYINLFWSLLEL